MNKTPASRKHNASFKICPSCGCSVPAQERFCVYCGQVLESGASSRRKKGLPVWAILLIIFAVLSAAGASLYIYLRPQPEADEEEYEDDFEDFEDDYEDDESWDEDEDSSEYSFDDSEEDDEIIDDDSDDWSGDDSSDFYLPDMDESFSEDEEYYGYFDEDYSSDDDFYFDDEEDYSVVVPTLPAGLLISAAVPTPQPTPTPVFVPVGTETNGIYWENKEDGTAWIMRISPDYEKDVIYIPETLGGLEVSGYEPDAFVSRSGIRAYTISEYNPLFSAVDGVLYSIDGKTLISYPDQKKDLTVVLPASVEEIAPLAFSGNQYLESVQFGTALLRIGEAAFKDCGKLFAVNISDGVTELQKETFKDCVNLYRLRLPGTLQSIREEAFAGCRTLGNFDFPEGLNFIGRMAFADCISMTQLVIPGTVERIDEEAFKGCEGLEAVAMKNGTLEIGNLAFSHCLHLERVTLPETLETIGINPFAYCRHLASLYWAEEQVGHRNFVIEDMVLFSEDRMELLSYPCGLRPTSYTIPGFVKIIGPKAFSGSYLLLYLNGGTSVTTMASDALEGTSGNMQVNLISDFEVKDLP